MKIHKIIDSKYNNSVGEARNQKTFEFKRF